jgi:hypothetical protein|nr:MAG TPA: Protein of unknown function (DUF551) [Caudoviricetes sp.]
MTDKEIIRALRICATHKDKGCGLCPQRKYVRCKERLADEAITMIERLTAENAALREKVPQWISVEDRLPEDHLKRYLIAFKDAGGSIVDAARYIPGLGWECYNWDVPQKLITHWMPLPEAPKFADVLRGAPETPEGGE